MSIAVSELWARLARFGIVAPTQCLKLTERFRQANAGDADDALAIAKFLIAGKILTEFQAKAVLADPPRNLRLGPYVQLAARGVPGAFQDWIPVAPVVESGGSAKSRTQSLVRMITGAQVQALDALPETLPDHLLGMQRLSIKDREFVVMPMPPGQSLRSWQSKHPPATTKRAVQVQIVEAMVRAVQSFHQSIGCHGFLSRDSFWIAPDDSMRLLVDPGLLTGPWDGLQPEPESVFFRSAESRCIHRAPEAFSSKFQPTPIGDIYSLGCIAFQLVTGKPPFQETDTEKLKAFHRLKMPQPIRQAIERGAEGDPLMRVIGHAMAKNKSARFADAQGMMDALQACVPRPKSVAIQSSTPAATPTPARKQVPTTTAAPIVVSQATDSASPQPTPVEQSPVEQSPVEQASGMTPTITGKPSSAKAVAAVATDTQPKVDEPEVTAAPAASREPEVSRPTVAAEQRTNRPSRRRGRRKRSKAPLILGGLGIAVVLMLVAVLVRKPTRPTPDDRTRPTIAKAEDLPSVIGSGGQSAEPSPTIQSDQDAADDTGYLVTSDPNLLWVPPVKSGNPPSTRMLPPGPGGIVTIRMVSVRDGSAPLAQAVAPEFQSLIQWVSQRAGVSATEIDRLTLAMHPGQEGWPEISLAVRLESPQPKKELLDRWGAAATLTSTGATLYATDDDDPKAYYLSLSGESPEMVQAFAVGSIKRVSEIAELNGEAILLPRSQQRLWDAASDQSDLVALITPNFLLADARQLIGGGAEPLLDPLKRLLVPDVSGVLLAVTTGRQRVFVETRFAPAGQTSAVKLRNDLEQTVDQWPDWANQFLVEAVPDPSWRLLATRLPQMMAFVRDNTRSGLVDGNVVINAYLPEQGAAQWSLATLLALNTPRGATSQPSTVPISQLTIEQMLDRKMSIDFEQESLEFAAREIVEQFNQSLPAGSEFPPVRLIGSDLEKMGITQNQQVRDFRKVDQTLRSVLTDLVVGANPDKTVTGPADPNQAVVWTVDDDPQSPGRKAVLITTRPAATAAGTLPAEFRLSN
ncbi:MAG: hypothetical protein AAGA03_01360 [Planctomycetota bacterium]